MHYFLIFEQNSITNIITGQHIKAILETITLGVIIANKASTTSKTYSKTNVRAFFINRIPSLHLAELVNCYLSLIAFII